MQISSVMTSYTQANFYQNMMKKDISANLYLACERRRIFSVTSSAENNVCEPELENDSCDVTTFVFSLANHIA